jgi:hypothetical protein
VITTRSDKRETTRHCFANGATPKQNGAASSVARLGDLAIDSLPGWRLSLQKRYHRSEQWIMVRALRA